MPANLLRYRFEDVAFGETNVPYGAPANERVVESPLRLFALNWALSDCSTLPDLQIIRSISIPSRGLKGLAALVNQLHLHLGGERRGLACRHAN